MGLGRGFVVFCVCVGVGECAIRGGGRYDTPLAVAFVFRMCIIDAHRLGCGDSGCVSAIAWGLRSGVVAGGGDRL